MKIFISTGFSGKDEIDILKQIECMKKISRKAFINEDSEIEFVHNYFYKGRTDVKKPRLDCLGEAIKKLSDCDIIVLDPEYRKYKGCLIEKKIAEMYGIRAYKVFYDELAELFYEAGLD